MYLASKSYINCTCLCAGRPEIIRPPAGLNTVAAGAKVTFGCISDGSPPPPIEWLFNDNVEITTVSYRIISYQLRSSCPWFNNLLILHVYMCIPPILDTYVASLSL